MTDEIEMTGKFLFDLFLEKAITSCSPAPKAIYRLEDGEFEINWDNAELLITNNHYFFQLSQLLVQSWTFRCKNQDQAKSAVQAIISTLATKVPAPYGHLGL